MRGTNRGERQITAVFCGTMTGDILPIQLIYQGKTPRCHPHYRFVASCHVIYSVHMYVQVVIIPTYKYVAKVREDIGDDKFALVIMDNFKGQVNSLLDAHNIDACLLIVTNLYQSITTTGQFRQQASKGFLKRNSNFGIPSR